MFQGQMAPVGLILLFIGAVLAIPVLVGAIGVVAMIGRAMGL